MSHCDCAMPCDNPDPHIMCEFHGVSLADRRLLSPVLTLSLFLPVVSSFFSSSSSSSVLLSPLPPLSLSLFLLSHSHSLLLV